MKRLSTFWRTITKEPDATAIALLILVLGIGAGLHSAAPLTMSLTCDQPALDAAPFALELEDFEFGDVEFPDLELLPEIEVEFVDPAVGVGPI